MIDDIGNGGLGAGDFNFTNLLASGTTGWSLNIAEIKQARNATENYDWIYSAPVLLKVADDYYAKGEKKKAATIYAQLASIPLDCPEVKKAKKRQKPD